ncbi:MAG: hypothetical protein ACJ74Q_15130 [Pyrinomonadaceae bacterium]
MPDSTHPFAEALARICDGPPYDGTGVPTDRPYAYTRKRTGAWAYARSTSGLFVALMCDDPTLPTCAKNIDRHLACKRNPVAATTAGRLRGWLGGLAVGGFTLARFGYTVCEILPLSLALSMPFIDDADETHVHAPVNDFARVETMARRWYLNGLTWRASGHPRAYCLENPLPVPFTEIPDFLDHLAESPR